VARDGCTKEVYTVICDYIPERRTRRWKIAVQLPCCCSTDYYLNWYKNTYGVDLLSYLKQNYQPDYLIGGDGALCRAIQAGWRIEDLILWMGPAKRNYGNIKYLINKIYSCYAEYMYRTTGNIDYNRLRQPLHGIQFEEPSHYGETWFKDCWENNYDGSIFNQESFCACIIDSLLKFKDSYSYYNDSIVMTLERLAYYFKYMNNIVIENPIDLDRMKDDANLKFGERSIELGSLPTNVFWTDYDDEIYICGVRVWGHDGFSLANILNRCLNTRLVDDVADDHYEYYNLDDSVSTGICHQAWINIAKSTPEYVGALLECEKLEQIKQINIFAKDDYFCDLPFYEEKPVDGNYIPVYDSSGRQIGWKPENRCKYYETHISELCIIYVNRLEEFFKNLGLFDIIVPQKQICSEVLSETWHCKYIPCNLCDPNNEGDWWITHHLIGG
jgi:hypothetical protein